MSTQRRQPAGVPIGGQFTTGLRAEPAVELTSEQVAVNVEGTPSPYPRSADRPDAGTWQYPVSVPRFDALTAYDDVAGTYTIGDDLHVRAPSGAPTYWIGTVRPLLAQLHRAGRTGNATAHGAGFRDDGWHLELVTLSGRTLSVDVRSDPSHQGIHFVGQTSAGAGTYDGTLIPQDAVDAAALRVVTADALIATWRTQVVAAVGGKAWRTGLAFVPHSPNPTPTLTVRPQVGQVDTHVTFGPDGQVATIRESKGSDWDLGTPREFALANLGRRIGLTGGRRAGVPARVESMLTATAATNTHPDVAWLKANQARAQATDRD